jgi:hypothetical protein
MRSTIALIFLAGGIAHAAGVFRPGEPWLDNRNVPINAHGGGVLFHAGVYYWFGEHKVAGPEGNRAMVGVHCYSSKNLYDWADEGISLKVSSDPASEIAAGSVIERPKVIYNASTRKFVMWFHLELKGKGYEAARAAVAVADKVTGPYKYLRSMRPDAGTWPLNLSAGQRKGPKVNGDLVQGSEDWQAANQNGAIMRRDFAGGQMARDMTLFVDDDAKAYLVAASEENGTIHISQLTGDYQGVTGRWVRAFPGGHNEAPAVFKSKGKYYMITSGCTGWKPNAARSGVADAMLGDWQELGNPVRGTPEQKETTFQSQSTFILPVAGKPGAFIFMADRWEPKNPINGRYVWLPVDWEKGKPVLNWMDVWSLDWFM